MFPEIQCSDKVQWVCYYYLHHTFEVEWSSLSLIYLVLEYTDMKIYLVFLTANANLKNFVHKLYHN